MTELRDWREKKDWTQADVAGKIGEPRPTYQKMESGVGPIPLTVENKLRKLGFTGRLPREEAATASGGSEEVVKLKGRVEALEGQLLAALVAAKSLDERMRKLERRSGLSE
jgi:transcriptional regulator with XRE-family HTH domain